ncbi:acyl-CoA dehydrogenase [Sulfuriflexus mobilis]|uniref:acyl-CoA dehydrogenase n=1 Tax=Sulfuriflexus mobilis TaxID=1811807 RepID=UPI000F81F87D|nr:acyl-CoA dehydrogenase [Sulfuriflexus mobilis]
MSALLYWLVLAAIVMVSLYRRQLSWLGIAAVLLVAGIYFYSTDMRITPAAVMVFISLLVITVLLFPPIRRQLISRYAMTAMARITPAISQTERDALEAGTVWWDAELFNGMPNWNSLLETAITSLSEEEQAFINGPVETLCEMLDDWTITHEDGDLPPEVWRYIRDEGFFGLIIPKLYGGKEFSALAHSNIVMKIASRSVTAAVTVMVPNSLGPAELLLRYGTERQRQHYLPRLAGGKEIPCFALTEPTAGSDAASLTSSGEVCYGKQHGKDVLGIRLNWEKRYITLGPVATLLGLAFRLYDPEHLLGEEEDLGITLALINTDTAGVEIGQRHWPLDIAFQNGPNRGQDVFIPLEQVIGERDYVGQGWHMLMDCLAAGRSISLPALATGAAKLASRLSGAYSHIRRQFKVPIGRFEGIQAPLARIAAHTYMLDAARRLTATAVDLGEQPSVISAIVKYQHTEYMRRIINDAMDIHGGNGICLGPHNLLGRAYQAIPISITVEGANILTRSLIIYGQGALRCHPWLYRLISAATTAKLAQFDQALFAVIGHTLSKLVRAPLLAFGLAHALPSTRPKPLQAYLHRVDRMSAAFALVSDLAVLSLGPALKRKEAMSGRLADALGSLYLVSATLKQFHDDGHPPHQRPLVDWLLDEQLYTCEQSLLAVLNNLPNRLLSSIVRRLCFPFGARQGLPNDHDTGVVSNLIFEPGASRDQLTAGIYIPTRIDETLGAVEDALQKMVNAEKIEQGLRDHVKKGLLPASAMAVLITEASHRGLLSDTERQILDEAEEARLRVIAVDDFDNDVLARRNNNEKTHKLRKTGLPR